MEYAGLWRRLYTLYILYTNGHIILLRRSFLPGKKPWNQVSIVPDYPFGTGIWFKWNSPVPPPPPHTCTQLLQPGLNLLPWHFDVSNNRKSSLLWFSQKEGFLIVQERRGEMRRNMKRTWDENEDGEREPSAHNLEKIDAKIPNRHAIQYRPGHSGQGITE